MAGFGGGEDVVVEAQDASGVGHADGEITLLVTVHDELLDSATSNLVGLGELGQALNEREVNSLVDLGELLEQAGKDNLLERENVLLHLRVGTNLGENGGDLLANGERVEVNLEDLVELTNLGAGTLKQRLGQSIPEESGTSRSLRHAKKMSQAGVLVLPGLIEVNHSTTRSAGADNGDGQSGKHDERGGLLKLGIGYRWVISLLALAAGNQNRGLAEESVVLGPSSGMEQMVAAHKEDSSQFLVVVGHHDVLGRSLAEVEKSVDILDTAESLLPELEFNSDVKLLETSLKMSLQGVGVAQVDGVHLRRILGGSLDMVAEQLAKTAELGLAGVLEAEVKGLGSGALVKDLETSIVSEDVENSSVGLPEELEPRGDDGSVGAVSGLFARDSSKEDRLWGLGSLEVVDVGGAGSSVNALLNFVGLLLGSSDLLNGELDELLQDQLDGSNICVLGNILVLV
jgi:hypothetical protein